MGVSQDLSYVILTLIYCLVYQRHSITDLGFQPPIRLLLDISQETASKKESNQRSPLGQRMPCCSADKDQYDNQAIQERERQSCPARKTLRGIQFPRAEQPNADNRNGKRRENQQRRVQAEAVGIG